MDTAPLAQDDSLGSLAMRLQEQGKYLLIVCTVLSIVSLIAASIAFMGTLALVQEAANLGLDDATQKTWVVDNPAFNSYSLVLIESLVFGFIPYLFAIFLSNRVRKLSDRNTGTYLVVFIELILVGLLFGSSLGLFGILLLLTIVLASQALRKLRRHKDYPAFEENLSPSNWLKVLSIIFCTIYGLGALIWFAITSSAT